MPPKQKSDEPEVTDMATWPWNPIDVECASCSGTNQLHEHPPELLAEGVKWECNHCGAANQLGGSGPAPEAADHVDECANCHATFDPNTVDKDGDGLWTCPDCGVDNRMVALGESATGSTVAS